MTDLESSRNKEKKLDTKYNLREYFSFLKKFKGLFIFLLIGIVVIELIAVVERLLFKAVVDNGTTWVSGGLASSVFGKILLAVLASYLGVIAIKSSFKWINLHLINVVEARMIKDLKQKYFNHIIHLSHNFHTTHKTGSMIARLGRGANAMERMTDFISFNIVPLIVQTILVLVSIVYFDMTSAIIISAVAITFVIFSMYLQNIQQKANMEANRMEDIEKGNVGDIFTNIDSIKYFGKENAIKKKYQKLTEDTRAATMKFWDYARWLDSGESLILTAGTLLLIYFSITKFLNGEITLGTVTFIYTIYGNLMGPLYGFVHGVRGYYRSIADFNDLFGYGKIENEIKDKPNAETMKIREGYIEFKNVSFKYHSKKLFDNFSLKIPKNKKVALVGHSGSGKSTLVKLLYRFYDVEKGQILIDGKNIKDFKQESLRSELSIVPQECVLFDDTIYNNIAFSNPKATRKEVMRAMKFAQLDKIVSTFPQKENTVVGERGIKLSGGEKQRVSIARAILANKKILVLDEATSSLDSETEHEIQKDLEKLMQDRTSLIIAHRLSTIMKADLIVVLEHGKVVQIGKHEDLIEESGVYRKLWNLQKGGYLK